MKKAIPGVSKNEPVSVNQNGGRQSATPYRLDLLPARAVLEVGRVFAEGSAKHGIDNWRLISRAEQLNHALQHILAELAGDTQDEHLAHAAARLLMAIETS
jgi:hypothetical protein